MSSLSSSVEKEIGNLAKPQDIGGIDSGAGHSAEAVVKDKNVNASKSMQRADSRV